VKKIFLFFLILSSVCALAEAKIQEEQIHLMKGESSTHDTGFLIGDVAVGNRKILDYMVSSTRDQIFLNALSEGETSLTVWDQNGVRQQKLVVSIYSTVLRDVMQEAENTFSSLPEVKVKTKNGRIHLEGKVEDLDTLEVAQSFASSSRYVKNNLKLGNVEIKRTADEISKAIHIPGIQVVSHNNTFVLEGTVYDKDQAQKAFAIASLYSPHIKNLISVKEKGRTAGVGEVIMLHFHLLEVKKSALKNFGIQWAPGSFPQKTSSNITGGGGGIISEISGLGRELIGFAFNLLPKIRYAHQKGEAKILEEPSLMVKNGEDAEMFSGTEVPYYQAEQVHFKQMGLKIEASPIYVDNKVDLQIRAKLSAPSSNLEGGIDESSVNTSVICPLGESLVLANIIRNSEVKMKNRIPKDIDTSSALFSLLSSRDFQSNKSEFVLVVTPSLVGSSAEESAVKQLSRWSQSEEEIIKNRSKKEYREYIAEKTLGEVIKPKKRKVQWTSKYHQK